MPLPLDGGGLGWGWDPAWGEGDVKLPYSPQSALPAGEGE
jgi:hypothetical protein